MAERSSSRRPSAWRAGVSARQRKAPRRVAVRAPRGGDCPTSPTSPAAGRRSAVDPRPAAPRKSALAPEDPPGPCSFHEANGRPCACARANAWGDARRPGNARRARQGSKRAAAARVTPLRPPVGAKPCPPSPRCLQVSRTNSSPARAPPPSSRRAALHHRTSDRPDPSAEARSLALCASFPSRQGSHRALAASAHLNIVGGREVEKEMARARVRRKGVAPKQRGFVMGVAGGGRSARKDRTDGRSHAGRKRRSKAIVKGKGGR